MVLLALVLVPTVVWGQPETPPRLDPVVVTGTRTAEPLQTLGSSVTVITRQEIEASGATDVVELLRYVPGLTIGAGSRGTIAVAGPRGGSDAFTLILLDGVKINDAIFGFTLATISTVNVERIEIVRGSMSAVYGPDAMGAVIHIITRRGEGRPQGDVSVAAGNLNTFEEAFSVSGARGRLGYSFGAERIDADGSLPINSGFRSTTVSGRADWRHPEFLQTTLTLRFVDSTTDLPARGADRFEILDPRQSLHQQRLVLGAVARHRLTASWEQTVQLGFQRYDFDLDDPFDHGIGDADLASRSTHRRVAADYFWTVSLPSVAGIAAKVTAGVAVDDETFDLTTTMNNSLPFRSSIRAHRRNTGGYVQAHTEWRSSVFLTAGLRVDQSNAFGTEQTPRVQGAWALPTGTTLRGGYGEGIKAPSFVETFGNGSPFVAGNPNLSIERARTWEAGFDQSLGRAGVDVSVTYFETRFEDLITILIGRVPSFENIRLATSRGVEFAGMLRPGYGVTLRPAYTFLDTRIVENAGLAATELPEGRPLLRRPRHNGSLAADWLHDRLLMNVTVTVVGDSEDLDPRTIPLTRTRLKGYSRFDSAASYRLPVQWPGISELTLFGRARNLLDDRYEEGFGFAAPGRTFLAGIRASF